MRSKAAYNDKRRRKERALQKKKGNAKWEA